mmetsp:Transcript_24661/g.55743  ORF Transcript_24661/g.55743 Transcript_24661/m.55743 type:complete len:88 (-) Transcript_24661:2570-2833(-)
MHQAGPQSTRSASVAKVDPTPQELPGEESEEKLQKEEEEEVVEEQADLHVPRGSQILPLQTEEEQQPTLVNWVPLMIVADKQFPPRA